MSFQSLNQGLTYMSIQSSKGYHKPLVDWVFNIGNILYCVAKWIAKNELIIDVTKSDHVYK